MTVVKHIGLAAAVAVILVVGLPSVAVPQAIAATAPSLEVGGSVEGYVLSDLGSPLGGAIIVATGGSGEASTAYSEPDGHYGIKLPAGSWRMNVTARAHDGKAENVVVLGGVPTAKNFTLVHNGPALTGRVFDAATGRGIAGAWVEAYPSSGYDCRADQPCPMAREPASGAAMPEYYRMPYTVETGPDGKYALAIDNNDKGTLSLRAWRQDYRDSYQTVEVQGDRQLDLRLEAIPPKTAVIEGRVVDAKTGAPIPDAWVNAWPTYEEFFAADAAEGNATSASGGGSAGSTGTASSTVMPSPMPVPPCDDADCRGPYYQEGNSTQTDRDGRFRMGLHPGTYQFSVGAPEHGQHNERVDLVDGQTKSMEVKLQPIPGDTVTVRGIVVDKSTGKPVPGAWVSVENQEWGAYNGAQAGEDGRFELKTKPGWTMVWVRIDGGRYSQPAVAEAVPAGASSEPGADGIRAPDSRPYIQPQGSYYPWVRSQSFTDGQVVDLRAELQPKPKADVKIQGYVLDAATKQPLANAYVNVHNEDTGDWGWAQTDEHGSFVLLGRPGWHTINANAEGHFSNAVVVEVQGPTTRVDLALQPGQSQGYCCIAYATKGGAGMAEDGGMTAGNTAPGAPAPPGTAPQQQGSVDAAGRNNQLAGSGAATYGATGESLGPYDPSKAPPPNSAQAGGNATPGFAPLLGLAALGAAALVLTRRKQ